MDSRVGLQAQGVAQCAAAFGCDEPDTGMHTATICVWCTGDGCLLIHVPHLPALHTCFNLNWYITANTTSSF